MLTPGMTADLPDAPDRAQPPHRAQPPDRAQPPHRAQPPDRAQPPGRARQSAETDVEGVRALARAARLLERAAGDLGMAQYRVLSAVASGDERASRVAERLGLGRPTVSAAVDSLCRDGLLRRTEVAGDQRAYHLEVTPAGRVLLQQVEERMVLVLRDLVARTGNRRAAGALASLGPAIDELQRERRASKTDRR
jgi:DNA-binding MarR family transcriptional regulator